MTSFTIITILVFIGTAILEAWIDARDNLGHYKKEETKTNISIGFIGAIFNLSVKSSILFFFAWLEQYAWFNAGDSLFSWAVCLLLVDLHTYLFHFLGHKCRFFWAMHVVHHSSDTFNLTAAFRLPFTNSMFEYGTLFPVILCGFNTHMMVWCHILVSVSVFLQHTALVNKLGWMEYIFCTPSHHRVHHARNEKYIDKNFGGLLIIWDRLFGTFQEEEERPVYGLTKPLEDRRVVNVIFHEWKDIINDLRKASGWKQMFQYAFGKPGWKPGKDNPEKTDRVFTAQSYRIQNCSIK